MSPESGASVASGAPESTGEVLNRCIRRILDRLPPGWSATTELEVATAASRKADAILRVRSPDGGQVELVLEAKQLVERRDIASILGQLAPMTEALPNAVGVVAARYLARPVRAELAARGLSYVDAAGNLRLLTSTPGLFLSEQGADTDPWRGPGRPRGTLKGPPAARVVRALVDFTAEWKIRDLIAIAGASTGATYRVLDFLERQDLVTRDQRGAVLVPAWRPLLELWSKDYGFIRDGLVTTYIEPRGLPALLEKVAVSERIQYAVTGTIAAAEWASYAPARAAMIYVKDAAEASAAWGLRSTDSGVNVLLAEPQTDVVFERTESNSSGLVIAAPTQVAVDLLTGPGRNPEEARELLDWMERHESSWRK